MAVALIPKWTLGDRLRKSRKEAGISSHKQMAQLIGYSEASVKRWEADDDTPKPVVVLGWAVVCGVDPEWLARDHDEDDDDSEGSTVTRTVGSTVTHEYQPNCVVQMSPPIAA